MRNKVIVLPFLNCTNTENKMSAAYKVNTENVAYKDAEQNFSEYYEYDAYLKISNESNDLISNIYGESQLIELFAQDKTYSDKKYLTKRVNSINRNCLRLIKITNNLIQFQKFEKKQIFFCSNNVNIVEIIDNIVDKTSEYIKNKIIFDTNIEEKHMSCDINKFQKAILILLCQAVKHSYGKAIFVNLNVFEDNIKITVSFNNRNSKLINIFMEEMDNPALDNINELSLELSLCKSLIALHEGSITVRSIQDEIIFTIEVPCQNTDSIYNLYTNYINNEYLAKQIQIEFSDLYEM